MSITHLVTITPEEVLGPDVLVRVLGLLLQTGAVREVLPMLIPQVVGVDRTEDQDGRNGTRDRLVVRRVTNWRGVNY